MSHFAGVLLDVLTSPTLPSTILRITGALATVIIVTGIGIWTVIGAYKVFLYLVHP
jgi:hypothetical protein